MATKAAFPVPATPADNRFDFSLQSLLAPYDRATFLSKFWDNAPLVLQREKADYYAGLLTVGDIDRLLNSRELRGDDLRLARAEEVIAAETYTKVNGAIDVAEVYALFADGATIILQHVHKSHPQLRRLCQAMGREFGMPFQTNLYLTPPSQQGFKPHYDSHDVFLLQVAGAKQWEIGGEPQRLPLKGQPFDSARHAFGETRMAFRLTAGDMLYMPRGVMHRGKTSGETSLHITLGVQAFTWTDVMLEAVSRVCLEDEAFRRALPVGFGVGDFDRKAAAGEFGRLMKVLSDESDFAAAAGALRREFIAREPASLSGQLGELMALGEIAATDPVRVRPDILFAFEDSGEELVLLGNGRELEFPHRLRGAVAHLLSGDIVRARDLPGELGEAEQIEIVRRLVGEGFLIRVR